MKETRFKQTEIGLIPEDWEISPLCTLCKIGNGKDYKHLKYGNIPVYGTGGIITYVNSYIYDGETVCIGRKGTINKPLYLKGKIWTVDTLFYTYNFTNSLAKFLFYRFQTIDWLSYNEASGVPSLSKETIYDIKIAYPYINEQIKIISVLTSIDNLLLSLDKLIEKKNLIKQGVMQELLTGKKRLPGFTGEWVEKKLGEGLRFKPGFPFNSNFFDGRMGLRLIRNRDLKADDQITYFYGNVNKDFIIEDGDLLIGMDGDFMPCIWNKGKALLNQRVGKIELISNNWCLMFLFYALQNPLKAKQEKTGATTVKHLSHSDIEQMRLKMPITSIEQKAIATILSSIDKEIESLEGKKTKYEQIKQGMMQQLLTGKIRLIS